MFLIIALTEVSGIFNRFVFFCTHFLTCAAQHPSISFDLTVLWLSSLRLRLA